MKAYLFIAVAVLMAVSSHAQDHDDLIDEALSPLPEQLKANARITHIDEKGESTVLREGSNGITCRPDIAGSFYMTRCFPTQLQSTYDALDKLIQLEELPLEGARDAVCERIRKGELPSPTPASANYLMAGADRDSSGLLTVISVSEGSSHDQLGLGVNEDQDRPWLMWEGTCLAHIMLHGI